MQSIPTGVSSGFLVALGFQRAASTSMAHVRGVESNRYLTLPLCRFALRGAPCGQARKLWDLLEKKHGRGDFSHTFGALDPVQVKKLKTVSSKAFFNTTEVQSNRDQMSSPSILNTK